VPGPRLAARRAEAQAQAAPALQRKPSGHNRKVSTASNKSNKSLLGHRHKRTASSIKANVRSSKDFSPKNTKVTKTSADGKSAGAFGKLWSKESERNMIKEAKKWEILEKKSYSPVVMEVDRGHRPGLSVGVVLEST
jgi:hypothetical protein